MREIERKGDRYRVWSTVSDGYYHDPMSREDMVKELRSWGWPEDNIEPRLDSARVVDEWALSAEEQDEILLGRKPTYFGGDR